jgi:hydrogenase-1 operon protein HyaF
MTNISIPIIGTGSQPKESDGAELNFLKLPSQINTYSKPYIQSKYDFTELPNIHSFLNNILTGLEANSLNKTFSTHELNSAELNLLNEIMGDGEVSIIITQDLITTQIQESVLAGIWRVKQYQNNSLINDYVEISDIPAIIKTNSFLNSAKEINVDINNLPAGLMNALPLIAELNAHIKDYKPNQKAHSINLSLLPQTEQDLAFLHHVLGQGSVSILSRSYSTNRITSTATDKVWWVQYFNSDDTLILNTLEVSQVPMVACAALEDLANSKLRLQDIIEHDLAK